VLSEEALRSDWVRKEVEVACWRAAVGQGVKVIPVVMPGLEDAEIAKAGYGPSQISESQWVGRSADCCDADSMAEAVVDQFKGHSQDDVRDPLDQWARNFAVAVHANPQLEDVALLLGIEDGDLGEDELELVLAYRILLGIDGSTCDPSVHERMLLSLTNDDKADKTRLVTLLLPVLISSDVAGPLFQMARESSQSSVSLDVESYQVLELIVERAHIAQPSTFDLIQISDHAECSIGEELVLKVLGEVEQRLGVDPIKASLSSTAERIEELRDACAGYEVDVPLFGKAALRKLFVGLTGSAVTVGTSDAIAERLEGLAFFVLGYNEEALSPPPAIKMGISHDEEKQIVQYINRTKRMVGTG